MHIRVVLVEPAYSMNVGAICRAMKNFGYFELRIVNPKCGLRSVGAYKGAKHAKEILENAKTAGSLEEASRGCDLIIGTTGVKLRHKGTIRGVLPLRQFAKKSGYYKKRKLALVFGREGIGLSEDELNKCDLLINIETSPAYPVMNISHAAAVVLYSLSQISGGQGEAPASGAELRALKRMFSGLSARFERKNMRAPVAFKRLISRAQINEQEAKALLNLFRLMECELSERY
ncbi:tRNA (cytidine(34)-2'-O)-methyltransferase [uncultured archaeon]|nr:tRNA (cytidine(34)-2'-O)-methyltransferase [uncultured archaeon]